MLIIGAGQAGLAVAYWLCKAGTTVQLLDSNPPGASWARRWDSLQLFTPRRFASLPGSTFPGNQASYPNKDQVAHYLANYAQHHHLPVASGSTVVDLSRNEDGFVARTRAGDRWQARQVVVATGAFGKPFAPAWAQSMSPAVIQLHSDNYRRQSDLPDGPTLVVGGGNSGYQLALELAQSGRSVALSESRVPRHLPQRICERDLFWWLTITGIMKVRSSTWAGRRLRANDPVIGTPRESLIQAGVTFLPRATGAHGTVVQFLDGTQLEARSVVWATGYRHDDSWITISGALSPEGVLHNDDGNTVVPGLFTIGRPWQRDRGSALLGFVARDARRLARRCIQQMPSGAV